MISSSNEVTWRRVAEPDMPFDILAIDPDSRTGKFCLITMFGIWPFFKNFVGELCRLSSDLPIGGSQNWQRYGEITSV